MKTAAFKYGAVDDPKRDDRRIHKEPLARWGGIAIYVGIVVALLAVLPFAYKDAPIKFPPYLVGMMVIGGILTVFGMMDDLKQYSAKIQLVVLLGAGIAIQFISSPVGQVQIKSFGLGGNHYISLGLAAVPVTAFYIFVVTKTMDTIDGVDGLSAGIATIAASTLAIIAAYGGQPRVAIVAAAIAGGSIGFLRHNYNPAKIIMGSSGPYVLGFMMACLSIVGAFKTAAAVSLIIPVLVFGLPIFDAFFVIVRRIASGQPITQADKRHMHHTLLGKGLSQRQTVWVMWTVGAVLAAIGLVLVKMYA
ncbi:undecaprenyl/decaprenyl-phosphate alpha-N-acetylglucosaminyl 1-phosphate transferase [bacterium]|nr:MAG: undecaprenyl/decaprenyl-phosphate alpha-N-acetylglucosaminyl 1-phosphate transferase [bacterium]